MFETEGKLSAKIVALSEPKTSERKDAAIRKCNGDAFTRVLEKLLNPSDNTGPGKGIGEMDT
jgi:hypothetical protein